MFLSVELVQSFGHRASVELEKGLPISLQLLQALFVGLQSRNLTLGHPADALQLL
ncbi:MAG TPA: hypothetical protein VK902_08830 [Rubrobacter sp.]|nr:hypothetical protein [Rubrobacter sp.]